MVRLDDFVLVAEEKDKEYLRKSLGKLRGLKIPGLNRKALAYLQGIIVIELPQECLNHVQLPMCAYRRGRIIGNEINFRLGGKTYRILGV